VIRSQPSPGPHDADQPEAQTPLLGPGEQPPQKLVSGEGDGVHAPGPEKPVASDLSAAGWTQARTTLPRAVAAKAAVSSQPWTRARRAETVPPARGHPVTRVSTLETSPTMTSAKVTSYSSPV
jgi:hypothetical protein